MRWQGQGPVEWSGPPAAPQSLIRCLWLIDWKERRIVADLPNKQRVEGRLQSEAVKWAPPPPPSRLSHREAGDRQDGRGGGGAWAQKRGWIHTACNVFPTELLFTRIMSVIRTCTHSKDVHTCAKKTHTLSHTHKHTHTHTHIQLGRRAADRHALKAHNQRRLTSLRLLHTVFADGISSGVRSPPPPPGCTERLSSPGTAQQRATPTASTPPAPPRWGRDQLQFAGAPSPRTCFVFLKACSSQRKPMATSCELFIIACLDFQMNTAPPAARPRERGGKPECWGRPWAAEGRSSQDANWSLQTDSSAWDLIRKNK